MAFKLTVHAHLSMSVEAVGLGSVDDNIHIFECFELMEQ